MADWGQVPALGVTFAVSALACRVVVAKGSGSWRRLLRSGDLSAVQSAHSAPVARVGGIAVMVSVLCGAAMTAGPHGTLWALLLPVVIPLFLSGAAEDLGRHVAPAGRLGAALLSSALAVLVTQVWIRETGLPVIDALLAWGPVAVVVTVLAGSTMAHAFNLIDGMNGLAGFTALLAAAGLAAVAATVGDTEITMIGLVLIAAILGFLAFNYPFGRIFLGDAGAYCLGFLLAWLAIMLTQRHDAVTPLAMLLIVFWPLADLSLAIYRRRLRGLPVSGPDRLHFHQLVMRALEIAVFGRGRRHLTNPLTTALMLPFIAAPVAAGVLLRDDAVLSGVALVVFLALFYSTYFMGMTLAGHRPSVKAARQQDRIAGHLRPAEQSN